jgi:hypothetical protein
VRRLLLGELETAVAYAVEVLALGLDRPIGELDDLVLTNGLAHRLTISQWPSSPASAVVTRRETIVWGRIRRVRKRRLF